VTVHGRTAAQSYSGESDWRLIGRVAEAVAIPVFGSGDCVEAAQIVHRLSESAVSGVLVGRGALRNPWPVSLSARGEFLLQYIDLLLGERVDEAPGFRHVAASQAEVAALPAGARGRERWVINKLRALGSWYTKGLDGGSQLRVAINASDSIESLRNTIRGFFLAEAQLVSQSGFQ
jgi:tRNA-dihydrouridine synthase